MNNFFSAKPVAGVAALGLASLLIHPFGDVKARRSVTPLLSGGGIDPAIVRTIERSCQSCHSEKTEWPWYSYVAPFSWLIEKDVNQARSHMNLSHWDEYTIKKQKEILAELSYVVRNQ